MLALELIEWRDPTSHKAGGWSESPESGGTWTVFTAGWVTHETPQEITIHSSIGKDLYGHDTVIPVGCIVKRTVLRKWR